VGARASAAGHRQKFGQPLLSPGHRDFAAAVGSGHAAGAVNDRDAEERVKLLKTAWDLAGSRLGARHELYERFYAGDPARTYAAQYAEYDKQALLDRVARHIG